MLLLLACTSDPPPTDSPTDTAPPEPVDCGLAEAIIWPRIAVPGEVLSPMGLPEGATLTLSVEEGSVEGQSWTLPEDAAKYDAEVFVVEGQIEAPGCIPESFGASVTVDWPLNDRVLILSNSAIEGSTDVATAYADFRGLDHVCDIPTAEATTLSAEAWPDWIAAAQACIEEVGRQVTWIVPVYGVPYRVSGIVEDLGVGGLTTVSVDALLFNWKNADSTKAATWNPIYREGDSPTNTYEDWVPIGQLRADQKKTFVLVSRIDGESAEEALALIDRTAAAEALIVGEGLSGTVYVDGNRGDIPPAADAEFGSYEWGEWNMWGTKAVFEADGRYTVVSDFNNAEFGTDPAPLTCPDALYYAGWYNFGNYNDVFTWNVGAIGAHLDSCSACDIRTGNNWSRMALKRGITGTFGAVAEPYVAGMPEYDQFFLYLLDGASFAEAGYESTMVAYWMMVWVGDPLYRPHAGEPVGG